MPSDLLLRRPRSDDEAEVMRAHRATTPEVPTFLHHYQEGMAFDRYLDLLDEQHRGVRLPPGHVPSTFFFAYVGPRIVGRVTIRHRLNDDLVLVGGHIGFVVVPEFRRRGYATRMLRLALEIARGTLALDRVLVTCDDDNLGSIGAIERNGGVREDAPGAPATGAPTRRYWLETR